MGILDTFASLLSGKDEQQSDPALTIHIVLGALLSLVSKADGHVSEQEKKIKRAILSRRGYEQPEEQEQILLAAQTAIKERLDWQGFTREVNKLFDYEQRVRLIDDLFAVAWADHELTNQELETVRKIAELLWIEHKDFINAKFSNQPN